MSGRRFEISARKCGTHSTASKSMYVDTADAKKIVCCEVNLRTARDRDAGSYSVKHHFPSPIVSWIEDLSSFGDVSFSHDPEYFDEQSRSSVGQSSTSSDLHDMQISVRLTDEFMELAKENTSNNLETCGILGASFRDGTYYVTMLIIPKQEKTAHSCQAFHEEEIHAILSEQSLYPAGWIHTHPSQTCFLSSIDLHTQYSYQVMLPEAVAIVVAPTDPNRSYGIFRLTDPGGMDVLRECNESGFHNHRETTDGSPIYETCSKGPQPEAAQGGLDVQEPGGQRRMQLEPGDPAASTSSVKRKSPYANMPIFRSPLSRMFLSPRMHLSPVVRSPSMRRGISPSATLERSLSPSARSLSPVVARTVTSHDLGQVLANTICGGRRVLGDIDFNVPSSSGYN